MTDRELMQQALDALEALEGIQRYGLDTLSGRVDGPDDREWHRAGVNEMTKRARLGIAAIREALADHTEQHLEMAEQPAQQQSAERVEPVAILGRLTYGGTAAVISPLGKTLFDLEPGTEFYTSPPQRKPLTEHEAISAVSSVLPVPSTGGQTHHLQIQHKYAVEIARAIEAAHGIKGETK